MAYNARLAERVRRLLARRKGITEKKMFGGLTFLMHGKMCCGVLKDDLVVRVGPERYATAVAAPHARPMDFTGRPLRGFLFIAAAGYKSDAALRMWVQQAVDFASSSRVK